MNSRYHLVHRKFLWKMRIQTNRDLYLKIIMLAKEHETTACSLEEYLRSLWSLASKYQASSGFLPTEFFKLLSDAFSISAPPFQDEWRQHYEKDIDKLQGYLGWEATIRRQIVDLREMAEAGILDDDYRYFGVDAPRGHPWFNFDPATFLECAMAGTYGGWEPEDVTGRGYAPGTVVILSESGEYDERELASLPNLIYVINQIHWDDFRKFLFMGQWYE
jgi:hypothetical protein